MMQIYKNIQEFNLKADIVLTIGTFDGIHIGHQEIIRILKEEAQKINGETVVLTFSPHPRIVLQSDSAFGGLLYTDEEKIQLFGNLGIDHLIIEPFTKDFADISSNEFIERYIIRIIKPQMIVIGYNHHFGKNRDGSIADLIKYTNRVGEPEIKFQLIEVPPQYVNNIPVSSTKIRNALAKGDIKSATAFLGRDFSLTGKVIEGNKIGASIGFPTANILLSNNYPDKSRQEKLIPANGVYAVKVKIDSQPPTSFRERSIMGYFKEDLGNAKNINLYNGMLNIGFRPTLHPNQPNLSIEVYIIDFKQDIYGKVLTVYFKERIRDEVKFKDINDLKAQLLLDKEKIINILSI